MGCLETCEGSLFFDLGWHFYRKEFAPMEQILFYKSITPGSESNLQPIECRLSQPFHSFQLIPFQVLTYDLSYTINYPKVWDFVTDLSCSSNTAADSLSPVQLAKYSRRHYFICINEPW